jgi:hypothetical protein
MNTAGPRDKYIVDLSRRRNTGFLVINKIDKLEPKSIRGLEESRAWGSDAISWRNRAFGKMSACFQKNRREAAGRADVFPADLVADHPNALRKRYHPGKVGCSILTRGADTA